MAEKTIDPTTLTLLRWRWRERRAYLEQVPPNRPMAQQALDKIDRLLDARPRRRAVAEDGEIIMNDQSPWVIEQAEFGGTVERIEEDKT